MSKKRRRTTLQTHVAHDKQALQLKMLSPKDKVTKKTGYAEE
jgi:hypothetical protein